MSSNPYDNPEFAKEYVRNQVDRVKNRYEWEVTQPSMLQFLDSSVDRVLDYGCGSGIFTAETLLAGRDLVNPSLEMIGSDASAEILKYSSFFGEHIDGLSFQQWDANAEDSALEHRDFSRVFAKLVLNYVSPQDLGETVMPRLRECLTDDGLLVAVLPNPIREASYSKTKYASTSKLDINVGSFGSTDSTQSYHHTYEGMINAADQAGFAYAKVLGLPNVRFEPYKKQLMKIAHPMPMVLDSLNAAKRWVYVFGATESSADNFDDSVERFNLWRSHEYPEIADRAHIRTLHGGPDIDLPIEVPHEAIYDYTGAPDSTAKKIVAVGGDYAENLTPRQKIKLSRQLASMGLREATPVEDFLIS